MSDKESALVNLCISDQAVETFSPTSQGSSIGSGFQLQTPFVSTFGDHMEIFANDEVFSSAVPPCIDGGIDVLTWRDLRYKLLRARSPHLLAKNLPHVFEDNMNAMRPEFR